MAILIAIARFYGKLLGPTAVGLSLLRAPVMVHQRRRLRSVHGAAGIKKPAKRRDPSPDSHRRNRSRSHQPLRRLRGNSIPFSNLTILQEAHTVNCLARPPAGMRPRSARMARRFAKAGPLQHSLHNVENEPAMTLPRGFTRQAGPSRHSLLTTCYHATILIAPKGDGVHLITAPRADDSSRTSADGRRSFRERPKAIPGY